MSAPRRWAIVATALLATLTAGVATSAPNQPFKVTSTFDGKSVLPHRIHWTGFTALSASEVKRVDFLIDGKLVSTEHNIPYTFADDRGYLVTSWLTPGTP